mgnify:CR=1 FL=1
MRLFINIARDIIIANKAEYMKPLQGAMTIIKTENVGWKRLEEYVVGV